MKNVTRLERIEIFQVPIPGTLPHPVWAIKYVSGLDDGGETKSGDWLARWEPSPERIVFAFSKDRNLYYMDEVSAYAVSDALRTNMEIETDVVKVG